MTTLESQNLISPILSLENLKIKNTVKIGVMASGSGSNFEVIAQYIQQGKLNLEIPVVIYNNPHAKVKERCDKFNIKSILLNHRDFKSREDLDRSIVQVFQEHDVQLIIMAGWMRIITPILLNAFPQKIINIHPSLLPSFKGINAVKQALDAGVKITGCTVHFASLEVDSGNIIMQSAVPVFPHDTEDSLHLRIQKQEHLIFPLAIASILHQQEQET